jgi:hypothetical protein
MISYENSGQFSHILVIEKYWISTVDEGKLLIQSFSTCFFHEKLTIGLVENIIFGLYISVYLYANKL